MRSQFESYVEAPPQRARQNQFALGTYVPPRLLTNADLEKMVDTNDQWIMNAPAFVSGISWTKAWRPATWRSKRPAMPRRRGIDASEVEVIIVATVTPDMLFPATACLVQDKLGAKGAWGFDLSAACSGFLYALQVGAKLVESRRAQEGAGDRRGRHVVDHRLHRPRHLHHLWRRRGRGAAGAGEEGEVGLIDYWHEIDGSGGASLYMPGGGSLHPPPRKRSRKDALRPSGWAGGLQVCRAQNGGGRGALLARNGVTGNDLGCFIPHQANMRIIESTAERLGMPEDRVIINIDRSATPRPERFRWPCRRRWKKAG